MDRKQVSRVRLTGKWLVWSGVVAALALFISVIGGYLFGWGWTGIVADDDYPKRTLWDWLKLLIVPAVLAVGGYLFTRSESRNTQAAANEQAQDQALQAYLEQMGQMLLDKDRPLLASADGDTMRTLARARTLTVLARLDGGRKGSVVRFLYESSLVTGDFPKEGSRPVLDLREADLMGADLGGADLGETVLV